MNISRPSIRHWLAALAASIASPPFLTIAGPTDPVGYETVRVHANTYSLLAPRFHASTNAAGLFETATGNQVTDNQLDFGSLLTPGVAYVIEQRGPTAHRVVEVVSFSGHTLTLAEAGVITTAEPYSLRALRKLSELFSPALVPEFNPVEDFNPDSGDVILIPDGAGGFRQYYYSSFTGYTGYFNAGTGAAEDPYLRYTDALLVLRRGTGYSTIFIGEVKVSDTAIPLGQNFNPIGSIFPIGSLTSSGLAASLQAGTEQSADIVWLQDVLSGELVRYFYSNGSGPGLTAGWRRAGGGNADQGSVELSSGLVIQRRGNLPHTILIKGFDGL